MHSILGNSGTFDPTYMYLTAGVVVVIVVLVFVILKTKSWTRFRAKYKDAEIEIRNEPVTDQPAPAAHDVSGQSAGPNSPGAVKGDVIYNQHQGVPAEIVRHIIHEAKSKQTELQRQLDSAQEELKQKQLITEAVQRVDDEAERGNEKASAAIEKAGSTGDAEQLQAALISLANQKAEKIKPDMSDLIQLCREIAEIAYLRGDLEELAHRLNIIIKACPNDLEAVNRMGELFNLQGKLDDAERTYRLLGEKAGENQLYKAFSYGNLGLIYQDRSKLSDPEGKVIYLANAEEMHRKALAIFKTIPPPQGLMGKAREYGNIGRLFSIQKKHSQATAYAEKSLMLFRRLHHKSDIAISLNNLGCGLGELGDDANAEIKLQESLKISEEIGWIIGIANASFNLGLTVLISGRIDETRKLWTRSHALYKQANVQHEVEKAQNALKMLDKLPNTPQEWTQEKLSKLTRK